MQTTTHNLGWVYDNGGRHDAGYKGATGDCVVRAVAIATGAPYQDVYDLVNELGKTERKGKRKRGVSNARTGVYKTTIKKLMAHYGFTFTPTMFIGSGCKVHLVEEDLPMGTIIVNVSRHLVCVKDLVMHDIARTDSRGGTRCVYGYWTREVTNG